MSRRNFSALALLLAAAPLSAQMKHDHTMKVEGAGALPKGWMGRGDDDAKVEDSKVVATPGGLHVTSGPAAIYWKGDATKGPFTVSATFRQNTAPEHPEAYGLIVMGKNLSGADQNYAYFL